MTNAAPVQNAATLTDLARDAALRYLRSAVVVDDRPVRPPPETGELATPDAEVLLAPKTGDDNAQLEPDLAEEPMVNAFAAFGIACAILVPPVLDAGRRTAILRADIVVLDWRLGDGDEGDIALELIEAAAVAHPPSARRLICVYTSDPDLDDIVARIATKLSVTAGTGVRSIDSGAVRVHVVPKCVDGSGVSEAELPGQLIDDFVETFRGLVPVIAVNALSAVRDNLPRVLMRLGTELDAGYVGHCLMLAQPGDAVDHMRALLGDELRSVIDSDERTTAVAGPRGLAAWARAANVTDIQPGAEPLIAHLTGGVKVQSPNGKKKFTQVVTGMDEPRATLTNESFAHRMTFRSNEWGRVPRCLEPGTVLRTGPNPHEYFVCVQPACDSLHIATPTALFPFLPCDKTTNSEWDYVAAIDATHVRLKVRNRFDAVRHFRFAVDASRRAVALDAALLEVADPAGGVAQPTGRQFEYVGLLRPDQAKRLCQNVGVEFGRIGIDESEWQRLHLPS